MGYQFIVIILYLFLAIHYYLLTGITGAVCNIIEVVSLIVLYFQDKYNFKNKSLIAVILALVVLIVNILMFQNIYSIFPMIASLIVIMSFYSDNENVIRIIGLIAAICWLIYAIVYKSYISIIFGIFTILNAGLSLLKNKKKN